MRRLFVSASIVVSGFAVAWAGCKADDAPVAASPAVTDEDGLEEGPDGFDDGGTQPSPAPDGGVGAIPTPIKYVLVLVKENHTFDNYFTGFPGANTTLTGNTSTGPITRAVAPTGPLPSDLSHSNASGQKALADGGMNQFDKVYNEGTLPYVRYTEEQIPDYWAYARNFVLADNYFSTSLGPSAPGHEVFWAARSLTINNPACVVPDAGACHGYGCTAVGAKQTGLTFDPVTCATSAVEPCFDVPSLPDHLPAGFTWMNYGGTIAAVIKSVVDDPGYASHFRPQNSLITDLQSHHLANLTIAHLSSGETSEHPPYYPCKGEQQSVAIINAAMQLPEWKEMAIVVTWDDWGGFYDHVTPPILRCTNGQIFGNGFRLPLILVSPYAKKGVVLHDQSEQASVPRLVEELWGMPLMSTRDPRARDGVAGSLLGAFDFSQPPRDPMVLPGHACP